VIWQRNYVNIYTHAAVITVGSYILTCQESRCYGFVESLRFLNLLWICCTLRLCPI